MPKSLKALLGTQKLSVTLHTVIVKKKNKRKQGGLVIIQLSIQTKVNKLTG